MNWKTILKNQVDVAIYQLQRDIGDLRKEVLEGSIMDSDGKPYTIERFDKGYTEMFNHFRKMRKKRDMEEKLFHADEIFVESGYFTRSGGLREKVLNLFAKLIQDAYPNIYEEMLNRRGY